MHRTAIALLLALLVPLAGCIGAVEERLAAEVEPLAAPHAPGDAAPAPATTGAMRLRVVAPDVRPIEGAEVSLANLTGLTDREGIVRIAGIPAGAHVVQVAREGFRDGRLSVDIEAGSELFAEARLARAGSVVDAGRSDGEPHDVLYEFAGYFDCSATYLIITGDCMTLANNLTDMAGAPVDPGASTNDRNAFEFPLDAGWKSVVLELEWDDTATGVMSGMSMSLEPTEAPADGHAARYARVEGDSILQMRLDNGIQHETATADDMPKPAGGEVVRARAFVLGEQHRPSGTDFLGVGAVLGHSFTLYVTVFYEDRAPDGYSVKAAS